MCCSAKRPPKSFSKPSRRGRNRRGQSLVEFAIVSFVVYMLLAAILTFGQMLFYDQTLQQAADVAAREISRTPLPPTADLMDVLYSNDPQWSSVRLSLFNPLLLQYDLTQLTAGQSVLDVVGTWPIINQMLFPAMIVAPDTQMLCYPGAVACTDNSNPNSNRSVPCIARVDSLQANGAESITWVPVIEEITSPADAAAGVTPFSVASPERGLVALRINYGFEIGGHDRLSTAARPVVAARSGKPVGSHSGQ